MRRASVRSGLYGSVLVVAGLALIDCRDASATVCQGLPPSWALSLREVQSLSGASDAETEVQSLNWPESGGLIHYGMNLDVGGGETFYVRANRVSWSPW